MEKLAKLTCNSCNFKDYRHYAFQTCCRKCGNQCSIITIDVLDFLKVQYGGDIKAFCQAKNLTLEDLLCFQ